MAVVTSEMDEAVDVVSFTADEAVAKGVSTADEVMATYGNVPGARLGLHCLVCLAATGLGTNGSRTRGARRGPAPGAASPAPRSLLLDRVL